MQKKPAILKYNSKYILSAGFAFILGMLLMLTAIWYTNLVSTNKKIDRIINNLNLKTSAISEYRDIVRTRALSLHRLRIIEDPFQRKVEYEKFKSRKLTNLLADNDTLKNLDMDATEKITWNYADRLIITNEKIQNQVALKILTNQFVESDLMLINQVLPAQNDVINQLTKLLQLQKDATRIEVDKINWSFKKTQFTISTLGATTTIIGFFIALYVVKRTNMAEVVLLHANQNAIEANRLKSEFLAKMSHELRTPLNAIIGFSQVLKEDAEDEGRQDFVDDLTKIEKSGTHLLEVINNVLDLSRIEAGKLDVIPQDISIKAMLVDLEKTISPMKEKNNNTLRINCPEDIGIIYSDEKRIKQSLYNIFSNAFKFSNNGVVSLDVSRTFEDDEVEYLAFKISDTGIGIDHTQIRKLFEPFIQLDSTINRRYGGTGLGLVLAKRYCELLGGDILVHSEIGIGSSFTIILPVKYTEA